MTADNIERNSAARQNGMNIEIIIRKHFIKTVVCKWVLQRKSIIIYLLFFSNKFKVCNDISGNFSKTDNLSIQTYYKVNYLTY